MNKDEYADRLLWKETFLPVPCVCSKKYYDIKDCPVCSPVRNVNQGTGESSLTKRG